MEQIGTDQSHALTGALIQSVNWNLINPAAAQSIIVSLQLMDKRAIDGIGRQFTEFINMGGQLYLPKDDSVLLVNYNIKPAQYDITIKPPFTGLIEYKIDDFSRVSVKEICRPGDTQTNGKVNPSKFWDSLRASGLLSPDARVLEEMVRQKPHLIPEEWKDNKSHWFMSTLFQISKRPDFRHSLTWGNRWAAHSARQKDPNAWHVEAVMVTHDTLLMPDDFVVVMCAPESD